MKIFQPMKFLFILICFVIFPIQISLAAPQPPIPVGRVVWIKGNLKAVMDNKEERTLQKSNRLFICMIP